MKSFLKKQLDKFSYAFQGLFHGLRHDSSIRFQAGIAVFVVLLSGVLSLELWEWCVITGAICLVLALEFVNSAIEHLVDFVSPAYHEQAKIIKDYCAAAVLLVSMLAAAAGIYIIGGKLW